MKGSQEFQENSQEIKWALVSLLEHQDCSLNATRPILLFYYTKYPTTGQGYVLKAEDDTDDAHLYQHPSWSSAFGQ
jgi:hypothetical protein